MDLDSLDYPRLVHNAGECRRVENATDAAIALEDGWTLKQVLTDAQKAERTAARAAVGEDPLPEDLPEPPAIVVEPDPRRSKRGARA